MLLFEAMGGSGKSMLTWQWLTKDAPSMRSDWVGRFWFSFYEKGAVMASFCRQALGYMTGKPVEDFAKLRTPRLADLLLAELDRRPWLLVLDGLERVLVAYQRADAAQLADEKADDATDPIEKRDLCTAIHPEDDELLRRLAAVAKSKILITCRLTPHALINRSGIAVPGVRRELLKGLRPDDAEAMFRDSGISGESRAIQHYLQSNCDCHPLVIGALAGLINAYAPNPGNFDRWVDDPRHGRALNLGKLDLIHRKSHILQAAIDVLEPESRRLLQTLSLLQTGADYDMLTALNPHLPPEPKKVEEPADPEKDWIWKYPTRKSAGNYRHVTRNSVRNAKLVSTRSPHGRTIPRCEPHLQNLTPPSTISKSVACCNSIRMSGAMTYTRWCGRCRWSDAKRGDTRTWPEGSRSF